MQALIAPVLLFVVSHLVILFIALQMYATGK